MCEYKNYPEYRQGLQERRSCWEPAALPQSCSSKWLCPRRSAPWRSGPCNQCHWTRRCLQPQQPDWVRSEEHTSELQSLMRISYAVFCLKKKKIKHIILTHQ